MTNDKELNDFIENSIGFEAYRYSRTIYTVKMLQYVRQYFKPKNIDIPIKNGRLSKFARTQFKKRFDDRNVDLYNRNSILSTGFDLFKHVEEDGDTFIKTIESEFDKGLEPYKKLKG